MASNAYDGRCSECGAVLPRDAYVGRVHERQRFPTGGACMAATWPPVCTCGEAFGSIEGWLAHEAANGRQCAGCGERLRVWTPPADIEARIAAAMAAAEEDDDVSDQ